MDSEIVEKAQRQAELCSVFGNYRRVLILWTLVERKKSVSEIATAINASLQNTSQHLHLMKEKGLLQSHRAGQTIFYRIADDIDTQPCQLLIESRKKQLISEAEPGIHAA
jgi:DNA-binding transcriptional ArsR family regulator